MLYFANHTTNSKVQHFNQEWHEKFRKERLRIAMFEQYANSRLFIYERDDASCFRTK